MLITSIRRKLLAGLGLVSLILFALTAGGSYVLMSYEQVVNDLDQVITEAPRRDAMLDAVVGLRRELKRYRADAQGRWNRELYLRRKPQMIDRIEAARAGAVEFRRRLEKLGTGSPEAFPAVVGTFLFSIDRQIYHLAGRLHHLDEHEHPANELAAVQLAVDDLFDGIWQLDEPLGDMALSLDKAHRVYETGNQTLLWTAVFSLVLLIGLIRCGYRWVFQPIRVLYEGTSRVAQGDYDYRVRLDQQDEMGELAEAFNKMTARFQEIRDDLDRQVRERVNQLIRSERLASIGFLAAGVAHEINTPLTSISMVAESILMRKDQLLGHLTPEERADLEEDLEILRTEPQQCRTITRKLLEFARGEGTERTRFDLTEVVREVLHMVGHLGKFRSYKLDFDYDAPCEIEANRSEIKQVILNLVANGLEAMDERGTLTVELHESTDQVELRIRDEGFGMTPDVLEHLFEPFYTHNKPGKGTGIGLAITHRIIAEHGGTIQARSDGHGHGSTFHIHLLRKAKARQAA
jgi:two-component system, NtrC family, sensor kinase